MDNYNYESEKFRKDYMNTYRGRKPRNLEEKLAQLNVRTWLNSIGKEQAIEEKIEQSEQSYEVPEGF